MNKKVLGVVAFMLFSFYGNAQTITKLNAEGYFAKISPDGETVVFSSTNGYKGLNKLNLKTKHVDVLSKEASAGYKAVVNNDCVFYKTEENAKQVHVLNLKVKSLNKVYSTSINAVVLQKKSLGKTISYIPVDVTSSKDLNAVNIIYSNGDVKQIASKIGDRKIWVSLSPNRTKILYTVVGKQTFVTDLNGNVLETIERAEAPKWANDKTIVFMITNEKNDDFISSNIYKYTLGTDKEILLTSNFNEISLYPVMSEDETKVVFNNEKGELYLIETTKN